MPPNIFDPAQKIPAETWAGLEKTLVLTPTSYGLQPYHFLVVQDPAVRAALLSHSWHQKQVVDCSHFVVFTARTEMGEADVARLIAADQHRARHSGGIAEFLPAT